jgi:demethylphylloquinone reductase
VGIVGGGYAGVELATVVSERLRARGVGSDCVRVSVITPSQQGVLEGAPEGQRQAASQALAQLGVHVLAGERVHVGAGWKGGDFLIDRWCPYLYTQ